MGSGEKKLTPIFAHPEHVEGSARAAAAIEESMRSFVVYMLECCDGAFYVGHTDDLQLRLSQHQSAYWPQCYTASRLPVKLVWQQFFPTRDEAFRAERKIKGWSRAKKIALVERRWDSL